MKIMYKGKENPWDNSRKNDFRGAWIGFDPDNEKEVERVERIVSEMGKLGWNFDLVYDSALCEVEDMEEYKELVRDYKVVKKTVKAK